MKARAISILLAISLLVMSASGCALNELQNILEDERHSPQTHDEGQGAHIGEREGKYYDPFAPGFEEIFFSDLKCEPFEDMERFRAGVERMISLCGEEGSLEELKSLYAELYDDMLDIGDAATIARIHYNMDINDDELYEQSIECDTVYSEALLLFDDAVECVLNSPYEGEFEKFMGEDVADLYGERQSEENIRRLTELYSRESELIAEYDRLYMTDFSVSYNGEEWTIDRLIGDHSLSYNEYADLLNRIYERKNAAVIDIYIELVEIRKETALIEGYGSAADYYYDCVYERDYTPEEAGIFHDDVKRYLVPVYNWLNAQTWYPDASVDTDEIIPMLEKYIPDISFEMEEMLSYMTEHGMCVLADDLDASLDSGYTTTLSRGAQPFVYNSVYGNYRGLTDTVHEFGHYCDFFMNGNYGVNAPWGAYDLSEISSIGLEMLFYDYYDEMFGGVFSDGSDEKVDLLYTVLYSIISGCAYDEAQQRVFAYEGDLTADAVNSIYREVLTEYGEDAWIDPGMIWVDVPHSFSSPFYYISYAAASTAAFEIWLTSANEGHDAAKELYLKALHMGAAEYSYFELLHECGMRGFRSEEYLSELAATIADETAVLLALDEGYDGAHSPSDEPYVGDEYAGEEAPRMTVAVKVQ